MTKKDLKIGDIVLLKCNIFMTVGLDDDGNMELQYGETTDKEFAHSLSYSLSRYEDDLTQPWIDDLTIIGVFSPKCSRKVSYLPDEDIPKITVADCKNGFDDFMGLEALRHYARCIIVDNDEIAKDPTIAIMRSSTMELAKMFVYKDGLRAPVYWHVADDPLCRVCSEMKKYNGEMLEGDAISFVNCMLRILAWFNDEGIDIPTVLSERNKELGDGIEDESYKEVAGLQAVDAFAHSVYTTFAPKGVWTETSESCVKENVYKLLCKNLTGLITDKNNNDRKTAIRRLTDCVLLILGWCSVKPVKVSELLLTYPKQSI